MNGLLSGQDMAKVLGIHPGTLARYSRAKIVPHIKVNKTFNLYDEAKVQAAIDKYYAGSEEAAAPEKGEESK